MKSITKGRTNNSVNDDIEIQDRELLSETSMTSKIIGEKPYDT